MLGWVGVWVIFVVVCGKVKVKDKNGKGRTMENRERVVPRRLGHEERLPLPELDDPRFPDWLGKDASGKFWDTKFDPKNLTVGEYLQRRKAYRGSDEYRREHWVEDLFDRAMKSVDDRGDDLSWLIKKSPGAIVSYLKKLMVSTEAVEPVEPVSSYSQEKPGASNERYPSMTQNEQLVELERLEQERN